LKKVSGFWRNDRRAQRLQNIKKSLVGNFCNLKKFFFKFFSFDIKYLKNAPEKFLQFLAKSTKSRVNTNMTENQNRSSFRRHFGVKTNF